MTYQKSKISFLLLAVMAVGLTGVVSSTPDAEARHNTITAFDGGSTCVQPNMRENSEGSVYKGSTRTGDQAILTVDIEDNNTSGTAASFVWITKYFKADKDVTFTARGQASASIDDGYVHFKTYIAKKDSMRNLGANCNPGNGATLGDAALMYEKTTNGNFNGKNLRGTETVTIPANGWYNVVVYADAGTTKYGGTVSSTLDRISLTVTVR